MSKNAKKKEGISRLFELAGAKKQKLCLACALAVISSGARIVSFFTIYGVVREVLSSYQVPQEMNLNKIFLYAMITMGVLWHMESAPMLRLQLHIRQHMIFCMKSE